MDATAPPGMSGFEWELLGLLATITTVIVLPLALDIVQGFGAAKRRSLEMSGLLGLVVFGLAWLTLSREPHQLVAYLESGLAAAWGGATLHHRSLPSEDHDEDKPRSTYSAMRRVLQRKVNGGG